DLDREAIRLLEEREAQVDGDAARLLLGQAVGVGPRQRLDQRGLAVVDVAGGADHDVAAGRAHTRPTLLAGRGGRAPFPAPPPATSAPSPRSTRRARVTTRASGSVSRRSVGTASRASPAS